MDHFTDYKRFCIVDRVDEYVAVNVHTVRLKMDEETLDLKQGSGPKGDDVLKSTGELPSVRGGQGSKRPRGRGAESLGRGVG